MKIAPPQREINRDYDFLNCAAWKTKNNRWTAAEQWINDQWEAAVAGYLLRRQLNCW